MDSFAQGLLTRMSLRKVTVSALVCRAAVSATLPGSGVEGSVERQRAMTGRPKTVPLDGDRAKSNSMGLS